MERHYKRCQEIFYNMVMRWFAFTLTYVRQVHDLGAPPQAGKKKKIVKSAEEFSRGKERQDNDKLSVFQQDVEKHPGKHALTTLQRLVIALDTSVGPKSCPSILGSVWISPQCAAS